MRVLTPEQMYIDVELCGQVLVMSRREQYLEYMVPCLQVRLSQCYHHFTFVNRPPRP